MSAHFSILAWKIPWTEEPGGLQSMVSQKRHNLATKTTKIVTKRKKKKKKPRAMAQKIKRKESKHCTVKSHQITEEDSKRETKEL